MSKTPLEIAEEWKDWIPYPDSERPEWDRYTLSNFSIQTHSENAKLKALLVESGNFLEQRMMWLTKEANEGGNWEHLIARRCECEYLLDKLRQRLKAVHSEGVK